ncbi:IclR family transcriptional regulator [Mesorhizobium sp. 8]|uniref:IclR family transcriptional regulator n=1 Tax=Mesorhizobium sp. 8 TaxID=2584466 RepID=UPI0011223990|nr:IclR family transcriptional regulator [Mesorhizobium sp. 8]QDC01649.1 IclR family transcriptional regulator [Mesorhizobium sp. 8]
MSSLESAIRILQCFTPGTPRLRVTELAERLDLPKSTVSRLLKTLSDGGMLDRDEATRQYDAGPVALQLGALYMAKHSLLDLVDEAVSRLVERFPFTGYVAVLDGADAVVLRCRQGGYPLKFVLDIGTRQPAAEAAMGIGLLSQLDETKLEEALRAGRNAGDNVIPATREAISHFKREGWVEVPCLAVPGITAIGSAVLPPNDREPAIGFSMSFPDAAVDNQKRTEIAREVLTTAQHLTRAATRLASI